MDNVLSKRRIRNSASLNQEEGAVRSLDPYSPAELSSHKRSLIPTMLIAGGGMGTGIARRLKWHLERPGVKSHHSILALDTDETSQTSDGQFPNLTDQEFCHLSIDRCRDVLKDPASHRLLAERLNLFDETIRCKLLTILDRGLDQAGQVRPIGVLAFFANLDLIRERIQSQLRNLRGVFAQLEHQLQNDGEDRLRPRLRICLTGSLAGGTYSSFFIDLAALIRHELSDSNIQLNGYYILPNALDPKLAGKSVERTRVRANAYSAITTMDALDDGYGFRQGLEFGVSDADRYPASMILHNQIYLAERFTDDNRDLETPEAVQDKIALSIAAEISTELGDYMEAADHNDVARQNLAPDPKTGRPRRFSTIGASALGIEHQKMARFSEGKQVIDLCDTVLGAELTSEESRASTLSYLRESSLGEDGKQLCRDIRNAVVSNLDSYVYPLYRLVSPNGLQYHSNRKVAEVLQVAKQKFKENHLPKLGQQIDDLGRNVRREAEKALKHRAGELIHRSGFRPTQGFVATLREELRRLEQAWTTSHATATSRVQEIEKQLSLEAERLVGLLQSMRTNEQIQDRVVSHYRQWLNSLIDMELARGLIVIIQRLQMLVEKLSERVNRSIDGYEQLRAKAEVLVIGNTPSGNGLTTASTCEIDMSSIEVFDAFYQRNKQDSADLIKIIAKRRQLSSVATREELCVSGPSWDEMHKSIADHFKERVKRTTIAQILEQALQAGGEAESKAAVKLREAVRATQPMWRSDPGQLGITFGDTITLGVPQGTPSETRARLLAELKSAAAALKTNPRYTADASIVTISDPHRILILRRSHGGRPHYLKCWDELKTASDSWSRMGGHSVDTFSKEFMALLPPIEPIDPVLPVEEAFTLALAFGWIAKRGPDFYVNLHTSQADNRSSCVVATVSDWDGLAFTKAKLQLSDAVQRLVAVGLLHYTAGHDFQTSSFLARNLDQAQREISEKRELASLFHESFKQLRVAAGDQLVVGDLTKYMLSLSQRVDSVDYRNKHLSRQVDVLKQIIAMLNKGV